MYAKIAAKNVKKSFADFAQYFLTVVMGVAIFYAFNTMSSQRNFLNLSDIESGIFELLNLLMGGASVFIAAVLIFLVVYANHLLVKRRKKEFALYLMLGMSSSQVVKIVFLELLIVGLLSLAVGFGLGFGLSQGLLYLTSAMFEADIVAQAGFTFVFSSSSYLLTLFIFVLAFVFAAAINTRSIMKTPLGELMYAQSKPEIMNQKKPRIYLISFALSLMLIGISYALLLENGLMNISFELGMATLLVCVGTILFFYALFGFTLALMRLYPQVYLRGLAPFTLAQLHAKVRTTFMTLSVVCLTLFLAISSVSAGVSMRNVLSDSLGETTQFSATVQSYYASYLPNGAQDAFTIDAPAAVVEEANFDMLEGLRSSVDVLGLEEIDPLIEGSAQLDLWLDGANSITVGDLEDASGVVLEGGSSSMLGPTYRENFFTFVSLSQVNEVLALKGEEPLNLGENQCALISYFDPTVDFMREVAEAHGSVEISGQSFEIAEFRNTWLESSSFASVAGVVVLPDKQIPESASIMTSLLNVQCVSEEAELAFGELCQAIQGSEDEGTWPISMVQTAAEVIEQSVSLSVVIAYLATYLGFILVIAAAAILAVQQVSQVFDSEVRYALLKKLGVPSSMINRSILTQVSLYFTLPLVLALAHTLCAMQVIGEVVQMFGHLDISTMALTVGVGLLFVYGAYFLVTYVSMKRFVAKSEARID